MNHKLRNWLWTTYNLSVVALAVVWRRLVKGPRFIAIVGSVGKTTTKDCLVAILSSRYPTIGTIGNDNGRQGIPRLVLQARRGHRYVVAEIGILRRGIMWRSAFVFRPDAVVMTCVSRQHMASLHNLDTVAREKAQILRPLRADGFVVLNRDDDRVAALADTVPCPATYFGRSDAADFWADEIECAWPGRLEFTLHAGAATHRVKTRFIGTHWTNSFVAAIAAASQCGVDPADSVSAVEGVKPYKARLQPVDLPSGAVLLRDDYNGTDQTYAVALDVLQAAKAERRVAVIGRVTDHVDGPVDGVRDIARTAVGKAEIAVFVGEYCAEGAEAARNAGMPPENIHSFPEYSGAAAFLRAELRRGDLALLKGPWDAHLARLYFAQLGTVRCTKIRCPITYLCDFCDEMGFQPDAIEDSH